MDSQDGEDLLPAYFYASIADIQSTIRVIDTKVAVVIGVLVLPFTNLGKIYLNFLNIYKTVECGNGQWLLWMLVIAFYSSWFLAFTAAIRAIMAINNPVEHVVHNTQVTGSFYNGGMFKTNVCDVFITRKLKSSKSLETYVHNLPVTPDAIKNELAFEQMKLVYIRDIKYMRLKWAYLLTLIWLFFGFISRMLFLYHCSN